MMSQKSHSLKLFLWKNFFTLTVAFCAAFLSINFYSNEASALFVPTLSASVDQTNLQINGNQVINSTNKTTEIPFNFTVNTNNRTGYTATLSSETENTALTNAASTAGAKINSISANLSLNNLPNNTWGYKFGASMNYAPIPALSTPAQILQTAGKTNGNESNQLSIGMRLSNNLESGDYTNKLVVSAVSNPYTPIALMTEGGDFNDKLKSLETTTNKIEHFKKSPTPPATTANAKNIEDEDSDYEIKLWLDPTDKTAYYYAELEKVYLNENSVQMFFFNTFAYPDDKMVGIPDIDLSNFDTSKVTNMSYMFYGMRNLTSLNLSNFDTSKVTDMHDMFCKMCSLTTINLSNFNTPKVTDMTYMFEEMRSLISLNLSNFDTSKVTNMNGMFYGMRNLTSLNISSFDTSKATSMADMFSFMSKLTSLDLSNFDTSKVTDMNGMFHGMSSLTSLDLSNFDTSKVTDMGYMFSTMSSLTSLNLSNFDTSKVTNMSYMFRGILNLTTLNLSNFNTSQVTDMDGMFKIWNGDVSEDKLEIIYVNNDFDTSKLTHFFDMFTNRKKLRGGNGSYLADPSTADKSWLRIDDPTHGRPGYFTRKS